MSYQDIITQLKGRGRGNWGHEGRPGKIGGSSPSGSAGGALPADKPQLPATIEVPNRGKMSLTHTGRTTDTGSNRIWHTDTYTVSRGKVTFGQIQHTHAGRGDNIYTNSLNRKGTFKTPEAAIDDLIRSKAYSR